MDSQGSLFSEDAAYPRAPEEVDLKRQPLAARMRPRSLAEVVGQDHILASGNLLPRLVQANTFGSLLFYGPPGCGKTSMAEAIAAETKSRFVRVNAVMSNVAELRGILAMARSRDDDTVLFIDEIHRFNKSQQDLLLPDVEAGNIRLIGATTHNPGFYVNAPLLSRSHLFRLNAHTVETATQALEAALRDEERGLGSRHHTAEEKALEGLAKLCDGDLRRALNALEVIALGLEPGQPITPEAISVFATERQIRYDANEDDHYDTISAFIKSMRGGDPDAALYWLAKMLAGGEDPRFIARRLIVFASEDIGLADSRALPLAVATQQACEFVGLPECRINLAHCVAYCAAAPKSNTSYAAFGKAAAAIAEGPVQEVPLWLRDKGGKASKRLGNSKDYEYSHGFSENISGQDYMETPMSFIEPKRVGEESGIAERLERWRKLKKERREKGNR
ncbi:replication-associated recombination protein A [Pelagicoccus sp. SDUM812003]|uniref:replication-associated recombination protein A n=1 Tax=Pelagicoccus sp. SDUM812003 TaxID=3041267 RepID=UPI00280F136E|nr:replication-associated recombination protein A [Pelagicoccus sp. SDUM812003]MDQ8202661.1 replication-associated recombination protein A [Pelagicoccus sp. SDUM812003]